jgi:hypothetical protein
MRTLLIIIIVLILIGGIGGFAVRGGGRGRRY